MQLLHRVQARLVRQHTALINQARAMLIEAGITVGRGRKSIARRVLDADESPLSPARGAMIAASYDGWRQVQPQAGEIDAQLRLIARTYGRCRRLLANPGGGVLTAAALVAAGERGAGVSQRTRSCGLVGPGAASTRHDLNNG